MSFASYHDNIELGDTVILYLSPTELEAITIKRGGVERNKFGDFPHANMIGKPFGSKIYAMNKRSWIMALYPTPELWTRALPHRTQIIYSTDISLVAMYLNLKPGSVVIESGTGSASLSHAIIRTVAPTGHLHTFEYHEQRAQLARQDFEAHGLSHLVTVRCRDACKEGFGLERVADAVFLDLPSPWDAVESATRALKGPGAKLCSFSPCLEQVQKTCTRLRALGYQDIITYVGLIRHLSFSHTKMQNFVIRPNPKGTNSNKRTAEQSEATDGDAQSVQPSAKRENIEAEDEETQASETAVVGNPGVKWAPIEFATEFMTGRPAPSVRHARPHGIFDLCD
ncbi:tRNA(m1A58)-methyltransferase subunit TRM61, partial [Capsaspora owczarzaki ATCC 30864]